MAPPDLYRQPNAEARKIVQQLKQALSVHAIVLPSLDVDLASLADAHRRPLIELGRWDLGTARALVAALPAQEGHGRE